MKKVVLMDFDGTLSAGDANVEFAKYCFKHSLRPWAFLPLIILGTILLIFNKRGIMARNIQRSFINVKLRDELVPGFVREHKKRRFGWVKRVINEEKQRGNLVILTSASPEYLIIPLISDLNFDMIFTSKTNPENPGEMLMLNFGENKVSVFDMWARKKKILPNITTAYSDSKNDLPMMNLATKQIWINPKTGEICKS